MKVSANEVCASGRAAGQGSAAVAAGQGTQAVAASASRHSCRTCYCLGCLSSATALLLPCLQVPSWSELNRQLARGPDEYDFFCKLDRELVWPGEPLTLLELPEWLAFTPQEILDAQATSQKKPSITGGRGYCGGV